MARGGCLTPKEVRHIQNKHYVGATNLEKMEVLYAGFYAYLPSGNKPKCRKIKGA